MPVNMDPHKRRKKAAPQEAQPAADKPGTPPENQPAARAKPASGQQSPPSPKSNNPDEMTERDRELALADAEWKNLWDATEVIDMDKW